MILFRWPGVFRYIYIYIKQLFLNFINNSHILGTARTVVGISDGNCPSGSVTETESKCIEAGSQLGMSFGSATTLSTNPAGCYNHINDHVDFNRIIDPSLTSPTRGLNGVCSVAGTEHRGVLHFYLKFIFFGGYRMAVCWKYIQYVIFLVHI